VTWCWIARLQDDVDGALASAQLTDLAGSPAGVLAAWPAGRKPVANAVRADARVIDPDGAAAWLSIVLIDRDRAPLFDDPAVSGALRAVLAGPPPDAVSTFVVDSSHFAGAVTVRRADPDALSADPFARIASAKVLSVGRGLFGRVRPAPGPVIQRYAGQPWPAAGF
jgi:hypothetical protein